MKVKFIVFSSVDGRDNNGIALIVEGYMADAVFVEYFIDFFMIVYSSFRLAAHSDLIVWLGQCSIILLQDSKGNILENANGAEEGEFAGSDCESLVFGLAFTSVSQVIHGCHATHPASRLQILFLFWDR